MNFETRPKPMSHLESPAERPSITVVIPCFNSRPYLEKCIAAVETALTEYGPATAVFCDNGSEDGSWGLIGEHVGGSVRAIQKPEVSISALRNTGASAADGDFLLFLDSDCTVPPDYLIRVIRSFESTGAAAVGCRVTIPDEAPWIPRVWHRLHAPRRSQYVEWLNSANFAVRREAFQAVGGFAEDCETGEDAEIGARLLQSGFKLFQDLDLEVLHHRNPGDLSSFFRKEVWRGLGMFGTFRQSRFDKPLIMTIGHGVTLLLAVLLLALPIGPIAARVFAALALTVVVPISTVAFRSLQTGRLISPLRATLLYSLYFSARLAALGKIGGRSIKAHFASRQPLSK